MKCLLCSHPTPTLFHERRDPRHGKRRYRHCSTCDLVFLEPSCRISAAAEKGIYDTHQNSIEDEGYVAFLNRLAVPMLSKLPPNACGLDFGSGPGPTLNQIFEKSRHLVDLYDPFFCPDTSVFHKKYDFITSTEVFEHLFDPRTVLQQLDALIKPNGTLGIMTEFRTPEKSFGEWWYLRDASHVCFYSEATFHWVARWLKRPLEIPRKNVAIFLGSYG